MEINMCFLLLTLSSTTYRLNLKLTVNCDHSLYNHLHFTYLFYGCKIHKFSVCKHLNLQFFIINGTQFRV
jgi:hypothetical protein